MTFRSTRLALAAAALFAGFVQAQTVQPPPRPIGSTMARPDPGMSEPERKRSVRAHHHKMHHGRDYTRDDSIQPVSTDAGQGARGAGSGTAAQPGAGVAGPSGSRAASPGGAGTGPAREKTDRGASGYFYGDEKKK